MRRPGKPVEEPLDRIACEYEVRIDADPARVPG
jgi:hypothetical protein